MKVMKWLRQQMWWRKIIMEYSFFFREEDGDWIRKEDHVVGTKIVEVDGPYKSLYFCKCGNEMTHTKSFVNQDDNGVWEYKCSHCGEEQYANGFLGPFVLRCDKNGQPLTGAFVAKEPVSKEVVKNRRG